MRLQQASVMVGGRLVVDRAALAAAVRQTHDFFGVTCSVASARMGTGSTTRRH